MLDRGRPFFANLIGNEGEMAAGETLMGALHCDAYQICSAVIAGESRDREGARRERVGATAGNSQVSFASPPHEGLQPPVTVSGADAELAAAAASLWEWRTPVDPACSVLTC
jgi:hypothetical protein